MLIELASLFKDVRFILLTVLFVTYFILNAKPLYKMVGVLILFAAFQKLLFTPLLNLENAKLYWYITWAAISVLTLVAIMYFTKLYPNIQKITIPVAAMVFLVIAIQLLRHFERNFTETNLFKGIYSIGLPTLNWMIVLYLFAPLALLLVKYLKGRFSAKH